MLGGDILADGGEVEGDDLHTFGPEAGGGADHEGGLPHLPGGEHVAELPGLQSLVEVAVRLTLDIGGSIVA